jgi:hypothetical protein
LASALCRRWRSWPTGGRAAGGRVGPTRLAGCRQCPLRRLIKPVQGRCEFKQIAAQVANLRNRGGMKRVGEPLTKLNRTFCFC